MFVFVSLKNLVYLSIVWATFFTCHLFSSMPSSNASSQLVAEKLFKNELDEIHKKMSETDQLQDKLDNQMEEIVKKVEEAQNKIAEAKKESFEILKEDTEARARTLFDEVNKKMQEIKEIQDRVQGDLNEKFAETATATKVELTQLETLAAQLKAKIVEYQATQPDEENKAIQGGGQATQEVTQQKEQGQVAEPSIAESFLNLLSTIAARTIKGAKRIKEWITGLIDGGVKKNLKW